MKQLIDKLPSGFRGYPSGLKLYCNPFTVGDLKLFFKIGSSVDLLDIYASKVECEGVEGFSVWDMYYGDFQFLVIQIYILSLEETSLDLRVTCGCGESFLYSYDLLKVEFKTLDVDVPIRYGGLLLRPPSVRDYREFISEGMSQDKLLDMYVVSDKPLGERLGAVDMKVGKFVKLVKDLDIGVLPFRVPCRKCGSVMEVGVRLDFFTLV